MKTELAAKTAELNECRNNQQRLERQLQIALDQKANVRNFTRSAITYELN